MWRPCGSFDETYKQDMAIIRTPVRWVVVMLFLVVLFLVPVFDSYYLVTLLNSIAITAILVLGLQLVSGYCGQISFGQAAFMAVGDSQSIYLSDPPCLRAIDTRIRDGRLHFIVYFRSWDLWAGFPSNLAAIQLLKEYMASEIGVDDGELIASSKGLHLYEYAWELAKTTARIA